MIRCGRAPSRVSGHDLALVTTGLDAVVHAESAGQMPRQQNPDRRMNCRIKSGNDERGR